MERLKRQEISDYALIGNCRTAALVSKQGSIDWACFPKFDSPSYFARLLDRDGGHFSIAPNGSFRSEQNYVDRTNVLETRFTTETGVATLTDCFTVRDGNRGASELWPDQEILRVLRVESGEVEITLEFVPRGHYGQSPVELRWIGNWGIQCNHGRKLLLLQATLPEDSLKLVASENGPSARAQVALRAGETLTASLTYSDEAPAVIPSLESAQCRLGQTLWYWETWSSRARTDGPYGKWVQRSALALKLLNFAPSGAFIAAPTTSLPENMGGTRNWDYRFCWLRDASFTTRALMSLGYLDEAKAYLNWLLHSTRLSWPRLQVLYSVYGESKLVESVAGWLSGFNGSRPVRIGNHASQQVQTDVYGEVIDSFYHLAGYLDPIDRETIKMVVGFGQAVAELWREPDQGIWEMRSEPAHYTHSKVMCWVAMDRLAKLSRRYKWRLPYDAEKIAQEVRGEIESKAYSLKSSSYTRSYGEPVLDASLLVMPLVGYCDPHSPRFLATQEAIIRELSRNGLIYRYPPASDEIPEGEGAFTLCNFWLSEVFARQGRIPEAEKWFNAISERLAASGLASEEVEPESGLYLGNFPQGFSHIGMINAALAIENAQEAASRRSA